MDFTFFKYKNTLSFMQDHSTLYMGLFYLGILLISIIKVDTISFTPDAYYYFSIAQNFTQGEGLTFDGASVTTGYHPLWLIFCIGIYSVSDNLYTFHELVLLVTTILFIIGHYLLTKVANKIGISTAVFIFLSIPIFLVNLSVFQSGVESALLFFLLSIFVWLNYQNNYSENKKLALSTVTLILIYFTRIDSIFLILLYFSWVFWRQWRGRKSLTSVFYGAIVACFILLHWFILYNNFGTIFPTSSLAIKSYLSINESTNLLQAFAPKANILTARFYELFSVIGIDTSSSSIARYIGLLVPISILACLYIVIRRNAKMNWPIVVIGLTALIQLTYFAIEMNGWMRAWYFGAWFILIIFGFSYFVSDNIVTHLPKIPFIFSIATLLIILVSVIFISVSRTNIPWYVYAKESQLLKEYNTSNHVLVGRTPDRASFFSDVGIRHLEGLVNSYEFVEKYLSSGQLASYMKDIGATHLVVSNAPVLGKYQKCFLNIDSDKKGDLKAYGVYEKHNSYIAIYRIYFNKEKINDNLYKGDCIH